MAARPTRAQDRQARNYPFAPQPGSGQTGGGPAGTAAGGTKAKRSASAQPDAKRTPPGQRARLMEEDSEERQQQREQASRVLGSWEMLAMYAVARGEVSGFFLGGEGGSAFLFKGVGC
jgi:hypothetical protein